MFWLRPPLEAAFYLLTEELKLGEMYFGMSFGDSITDASASPEETEQQLAN